MADDEMPDKNASDDLDPAFDSIDATMKDGTRREVSVTPEALAQIVNDAVAKAITAYEQARGSTPELAGPEGPAAARPTTAPLTPWQAKLERLKGDMGLDDIQFDAPPAEDTDGVRRRQLSAQMGVHDFDFEDAPAPPRDEPAGHADLPVTHADLSAQMGLDDFAFDSAHAAATEPAAPTRTETDAIAGWATPVQKAASSAMPELDETRVPATPEERTGDAVQQFDWVAAELKRLDTEEIPAALDLEPVRIEVPEPEQTQAPDTVAPAIEEPPAAPAPQQEVRETRSGLTGWFRSALGDRSPEREPAAAIPVPVPEPEAPVMPAAPPVPEPPVAPPPPLAARPEEPTRPARDPAAALKPMTPEEAAKTVFFTFDPFPPVPPRLPREPKEPPKD